MKVPIYNENCTEAGKVVHGRIAEDYEDSPNGLHDFGDCTVYEGSPAELLELADDKQNSAPAGAAGSFDRKVAGSIREAVYDLHPELDSQNKCDCELPGHFCSGVPGVLAHMLDGRLAPGSSVERCDMCERYETDDEARRALAEHLAAPAMRAIDTARGFHVLVYAGDGHGRAERLLFSTGECGESEEICDLLSELLRKRLP